MQHSTVQSSLPASAPKVRFVDQRLTVAPKARRAPAPQYYGAVRQRQGEVVEHSHADITKMDRRSLILSTMAEVKLGEVLQVVAHVGGRDVRVLAQVVEMRARPGEEGVKVRAHILAVARDDRAQFAAHIDSGRRSETESVKRTRQAVMGRYTTAD